MKGKILVIEDNEQNLYQVVSRQKLPDPGLKLIGAGRG